MPGMMPLSLYAERALIAYMQWSGAVVPGALDVDLYWQPAHRLIVAAMSAIVARGDVVSFATVETELRNRGDWERCGRAYAITTGLGWKHEALAAVEWLRALARTRREINPVGEIDHIMADVERERCALPTERGRVDVAGRRGRAA